MHRKKENNKQPKVGCDKISRIENNGLICLKRTLHSRVYTAIRKKGSTSSAKPMNRTGLQLSIRKANSRCPY